MNIIPLFSRDTACYRHWLNHETNPATLRDIGLCVCLDLEDALNLLDELTEEPARHQIELPNGWTVIEGGRKELAQ